MSQLQQRVDEAKARLERASERLKTLNAIDASKLKASEARTHTDAMARAVRELNECER